MSQARFPFLAEHKNSLISTGNLHVKNEFKFEDDSAEICGTSVNDCLLPLKMKSAAFLKNLNSNNDCIDLLEEDSKDSIKAKNLIAVIGTSKDEMVWICNSPCGNKIKVNQAKLVNLGTAATACHYKDQPKIEIEGVFSAYEVSRGGKWLLISFMKRIKQQILINTKTLKVYELLGDNNYFLSSSLIVSHPYICTIEEMITDGITKNIGQIQYGPLENLFDPYKNAGFSASAKWCFLTKNTDFIHDVPPYIAIYFFAQNKLVVSDVILDYQANMPTPHWLADDTLVFINSKNMLCRFNPENHTIESVLDEEVKSFSVLNEAKIVVYLKSGVFKTIQLIQISLLQEKIQECLSDLPRNIHDIIHAYASKPSMDAEIAKIAIINDEINIPYLSSLEFYGEGALNKARKLPVIGRLFTAPSSRELNEKLFEAIQNNLATKSDSESFSDSINNFLKKNNIDEAKCIPKIRTLINRIRELDLEERRLVRNSS